MVLTNNIEIEIFVILSNSLKASDWALWVVLKLWERHWFKHFSVYIDIRQCLYIRSIVSLHKMHNITVAVVVVGVVDK